MSLGNGTGMPLFGARIASYSPRSKSGIVWLDGEAYPFDMNGCFRATGGHTDVDLSSERDRREPRERRDGEPGENVVVYRRSGRIAAWGYRAAPELGYLLSPQLLNPHKGCTFTYEVRPRRSKERAGNSAVGKVVTAVYRNSVLSVQYAPRNGGPQDVLSLNVPVNQAPRFEDLRTGRYAGWGPVGRMIIELEGADTVGIMVLYER